MQGTLTGYVDYFSELKGFGFINAKNVDSTRAKFFFHKSQLLNGTPIIGSVVRFIAGPVPQGKTLALALQIVILNEKVSLATEAVKVTSVTETGNVGVQ